MKNVQTEPQKRRVNAVEGNAGTVDPNKKRMAKCDTISQLPSYDRTYPKLVPQKIRDEELKRIENERSAEKKVILPKIITKNEDETIDWSNGLEAKNSKEETTTIITMGLREIPPIITRISLQDQTSHIRIIAQTIEDHMTNAQISQSIEAIETDLEMNLSTIRMETGETMENFFVPHRLKE